MLPAAIKSTAARATPANGDTKDSQTTSSNRLRDPLLMVVVQVIQSPPAFSFHGATGGPGRTSTRTLAGVNCGATTAESRHRHGSVKVAGRAAGLAKHAL